MNTLNELAKAIEDNKDVYDAYVAEHATAMTNMETSIRADFTTAIEKVYVDYKAEDATHNENIMNVIGQVDIDLKAYVDAKIGEVENGSY